MRREVKYKIKGMNKDSSFSAFNPEFSFDNRNIRITTLEGNTTLSIVNEKGTKELTIEVDGVTETTILGRIIGYAVIDKTVILFTTGEGDNIYKANFKDDSTISITHLYTGNLNFRVENLIETLTIYENEDNIKVYWVDGINQPRVINIKDPRIANKTLTDNSFDFVPSVLNLGHSSINVSKNYYTGSFPSGVIQYCYTYFNDNGQESSIIDVSPLYYTSSKDRGGSPDEYVSNSFSLSIGSLDTSFKNVRIYSILRTSLNSAPLCKVVADLKIENNSVSILDTGTLGYTIDPADLLYIGGEVISAGTLNQKDNTLFLGNITVNKFDAGSIKLPKEDSTVKDTLRILANSAPTLKFQSSDEGDVGEFSFFINDGSTGEYPYKNQLSYDSRSIKVFKRGETYRCGLQFQHETGKWSSPVWLGDITNNVKPTGLYNTKDRILISTGKPYFKLNNTKEVITTLIDNGYRAVRPVIVYPTDNDRSCICQGVLNPTVYNVGDRGTGTTHAQASWFFRPNLAYNIRGLKKDDWKDFNDPDTYSKNSIGGVLTTSFLNSYTDSDSENIIVQDSWAEFRHNYFIPHNGDTRAEIQCIEQYPRQKLSERVNNGAQHQDIFKVYDEVKRLEPSYVYNNLDIDIVRDFPELYVIDQSIVTLNSPEIEFEKVTDNSLLEDVKLRYVGIIPITGNLQDIDIITSTVGRSNEEGAVAPGFMKFTYDKPNLSRLAGRRKLAAFHWADYVTNPQWDKKDKLQYFNTYPWHRVGSLNDDSKDSSGYRSALLENQKRSNLFFSTNSLYFNNVVDSTNTNYSNNTALFDIKTPKIFNSTENTSIRLNTNVSDNTIYRGNVDSLNIIKTIDKPGFIYNDDWGGYIGQNIIRKGHGYYISRSLGAEGAVLDTEDEKKVRFTDNEETAFNLHYSKDPVSIKYKSTPHAVFSYNINSEGVVTMPTLMDYYGNSTLNPNTNADDAPLFWGGTGSFTQYGITLEKEDLNESGVFNSTFPLYSWLWLAELYRDIPEDIRFGGKSQQAIENNQWVVAGDTYSFYDHKNNPISEISIIWKEGDHFYQRYDCLKTYPYTLEDTNSVVEILSFMCETRVNLDGRYDKNRGQKNNLVMTPNNFNLINDVYSQDNNFFNYREISKQYAEISAYINQVTWSKTKIFGEKVDTWTSISLASILDMDGDKGRVEAIRKLNNDLIVFQERGISQILYNDNIQISTQAGVPIEIANSGKVQGKRYLSSSVGCNNKWSICESPAGLYFIDDITKGIYLFNGNLTDLSDKLGFSSWTKENFKNLKPLTGTEKRNFISYYDPIESEVLFIDDKEDSACLAYSERLGVFTSFYDYRNEFTPIKLGDKTLMIGGSDETKIHEYHAGAYNNFYGSDEYPIYKPFHVSLVVNPEPTKDKIFNTVEFRADAVDILELGEESKVTDTLPLTHIRVYNEYQDTDSILFDTKNLKQKFRIWRHTIARDRTNKRDRIRNPWVTIQLMNEKPMNSKVVLHDVVVSYFD